MMKLPITMIFFLFTQIAVAETYSGCTDPQYIAYVEKRHSLYEKLGKEGYQKAMDGINENEIYSYQNIVLSARFLIQEKLPKITSLLMRKIN